MKIANNVLELIGKTPLVRINRMNTPYKDLYYYYFKSLSPIDLGISLCLKNKKQFNETRFISKSGIDI